MVEPDPWSVIETKAPTDSNVNSVIEPTTNTPNNNTTTTFEDDFACCAVPSSLNDSLPDSKEYIQALGTYTYFYY